MTDAAACAPEVFAAQWSRWALEQMLPPERLSVSEWAERHRWLHGAAWTTHQAPYLVEIMDTFTDPSVEEVVLQLASQIGKTEAVNNVIAYAVSRDPRPVLYVRETEQEATKFLRGRFRPMIEGSPELARLMPTNRKQVSQYALHLKTASIVAGWAGSSSTLASMSAGLAVCDEINKYPSETRDEKADPIAQARRRLRTYANRKCYLMCTPTGVSGRITVELESCADRRRWNAPCAGCGGWRVWEWEHVKWPKRPDDVSRIDWAERVMGERWGWLECPECGHRHDEAARRRMMVRGQWVPEGVPVGPEGEWLAEPPPSTRRGYQANCLVSLLSGNELFRVIAEWLRAVDRGRGAVVEAINQNLAEPSRDFEAVNTPREIQELVEPRAAGWVPSEAAALYAGMDVQANGIWWVVLGAARGRRYWLVREGFAPRVEAGADFAAVVRDVFDLQYPVEGHEGRTLRVRLGCMDSAGIAARTEEVYRFTAGLRRCLPIKGWQRLDRPFTVGTIRPGTPDRRRAPQHRHQLYRLNIGYYADLLQGCVMGDAAGALRLPDDVSRAYVEHLCAERRSRDSGLWELVRPGAENHLLDCTRYALAAADIDPGSPVTLQQVYQPRRIRTRVKHAAADAFGRAIQHGG